MSTITATRSTGKHTATYFEQRERDAHAVLVRGCQDAILVAQLQAENAALKVRVKEYGDKVIRAGAEHQRLRQAVINARPRITTVPTALVRPYSPVVVLPYVPPVPHRDTSNDTTQALPILDQPAHQAA
ncbi:hypothetical protein ACFVT5_40895 [Streptomyces sp. NPDC058001]|uniref:hypothetical protein n=1 Tax=Streptomyces sp. NPDC058001 TaxID=3346300 RepID=UPI0036EBF20F